MATTRPSRARPNWAPDGTGRALPYWTRDSAGKIALQPLVEYDSRDTHPNGLMKGGWFIGPEETGKESMLAPLPYIVQGKSVYLATMSVPIIVGGKFLGVAGADFDLAFVQKLAELVDTKIYDGDGSVTIVTDQGLIVASSLDPTAIGGPLSKLDTTSETDMKTVAAGQDAVVLDQATDRLRVFSPISIGRTAKNWSVIIGVPRSVVMADASKLASQTGAEQDRNTTSQLIASVVLALAGILHHVDGRPVRQPADSAPDRRHAGTGGAPDRHRGARHRSQGRDWRHGPHRRRHPGERRRRRPDGDRTGSRQRRAHRRRAQAAMHTMASEFEQSVGAIVASVSEASIQLQSSAETLTGAAEDTSTRSAEVAHASEEASTNVNMVASASEEMATSVQEISRQVAESARMAGNAVQEALGTAQTVKELSEAAQRIGEIIDLIGNVGRPDQPPGPQRDHRGGARRRGRQGLRGGGERGEEPRRSDRQGDGADQHPGVRHPELDPDSGVGDRAHLQDDREDGRDRHHHRDRRRGAGGHHAEHRPERAKRLDRHRGRVRGTSCW